MSFPERKAAPAAAALLLCFSAGLWCASYAQEGRTYEVSGVVVDKETGKTVPGVNVYLAGTTIGDSSDEEGEFTITGIPPGVYELVISHITYGNFSRVIDTDSLQSHYRLEVEPETRELGEIVVSSNPEEWRGNYQEFLEGFLGPSDFAKETEILNEEVLQFSFDPDSLLLEAHAQEVLRVENRALGYRIDYNLRHFSRRYRSGQIFVAGKAFFREMEPENAGQRKKWRGNRRKAYFGSFQHFVDALLQGNPAREGFFVRRERVRDGRREIESSLVPTDSIVTRKEEEILLHFPHRLNVKYMDEKEDPEYLRWTHEWNEREPSFQESFLMLTEDTLRVDRSGYVYDPLTAIKGLYWSYEKIPYLLPLGTSF